MARHEFESIEFTDRGDHIHAVFQKIFFFDISKASLGLKGSYTIDSNYIDLGSDRKADSRFSFALEQGFQNLKSSVTGKPAVYVHSNSRIPLIGNSSFGIIDRNTNIIEVKPITGCNLDCIYCSVAECYRERDIFVEEEYLINGLRELLRYKGDNDIEIHIGVQGEPVLYAELARLVKDCRSLPGVKRITMDTNATMLTFGICDELISAGLTRFNISLNSLNHELSAKIAGRHYNLSHVKEIIEYLAKKGKDCVHIAPVVIFGINDKEVDSLVSYAKGLGIGCWVQNYLEYSGGKKPAAEKDWEYFKAFLNSLEEKHGVKLLLDFKRDFGLHDTREQQGLFKPGDTVSAEVVSRGRFIDEYILNYKEKSISVTSKKALKIGSAVRCRIVSLKHNISRAEIDFM